MGSGWYCPRHMIMARVDNAVRTDDMAEYIHQSNLIEGIDDPKADAQSLEAWHWLIDKVGDRPGRMTQSIILELHRKITAGQLPDHQSGVFRRVQVYVGNHVPPSGQVMLGQIYGWGIDMIEHYKELDPKEMHIKFEQIHPFVDGNGRTGRMLMWLHEYWLGRELTLIPNATKQDAYGYYDWFRLSKS